MNVLLVFNVIALAAYLLAILIPLTMIRGSWAVPKAPGFALLTAMAIMVFVSLSNVLEHSGAFLGLDVVEDYIEVLVFPLVGYFVLFMFTENQMDRLRSTMHAAKAEHDLLVGILDTTRVGIVLIDDVGCVTFANRFASDVLNISECGSIHVCTSEVQVVPAGSAALERGVFHESVQGRVIDGEQWEVVGPEGRTLVGLTASPLNESSGKQSGSVVTVTPASEMSTPANV